MQAVRESERRDGRSGFVAACLRVAVSAWVTCTAGVACTACDGDTGAAPAQPASSDAAVDAERPAAPRADAALVVPICGALGEQACRDAGASLVDPIPDCVPGTAGCPEESCSRDAGDCQGASSKGVSCDTRQVLCKKAPPVCAEGEVPTVVDTCYGGCVKIDRCECHEADECPQREQYVCHMYAAHCGPYVN